MTQNVEQLAVDTIKTLAMDAVQAANSGHPGMPMGMADLAVVLWTKYLKADPAHPEWPDRDRFVLSNGHGSMLLYSLLHVAGYEMSLDDLKAFRQWGSPTAGHPEREPHRGIETTTGPLGQGFGNGVGLGIAEAHLRSVFGPELVDHRTWVFCSDGDLEEGVASEAASLAGHLQLGKLIYVYDDNEISIEGDTSITFTEDVAARFRAYGWHVLAIDGHDRAAIDQAYAAAVAEEGRPTLIAARTHIGHGAPNKQDTAEAHGSPLGEEEIARTKEQMGWDHPPFHVPTEVYDHMRSSLQRGADARAAWEERKAARFDADPGLAEKWAAHYETVAIKLEQPPGFEVGDKIATRKASGKVIQQLAAKMPGLIGGSADLAPSTNTLIDDSGDFAAGDRAARNMRFGVREHGMGASVNGMAIHGGVRPYGATFLVFSDYMRPSVRLSALMGAPSIWIYTHDSVFLGEDGPTHQPVEHLMSLRAMPGLWVVRPADAGETVEAWELIANRTDGPCALVLTRQGLPVLDRGGQEGGVAKGGYVLRDGDDVVVVATGSEVWVAERSGRMLADRGISARVVSLPCWEVFWEQDEAYRESVLGVGIPRVSLEAGATLGWERVVGADGLTIGIDHFGASAPWEVVADKLGLTPAAVADRVEAWLRG